jgi:ribonuclease BN (tRNA processing enzyme)
VRVQASPVKHPGACVGYRLFTSGGSIAFFPDNELYQPDASEHRQMIDFLRGTDVLIMDTQFDTQEYQQHTGWGHGCLDDVVALALAAEVKQLFLFHHDPNHDDAKVTQMLTHARKLVAARKGKLHVEAAREGVTVELGR